MILGRTKNKTETLLNKEHQSFFSFFKKSEGSFDPILLIIYFCLILLSILLVYSSSYQFSLKTTHNPYHLFYLHLSGVFLGLIAFFVGAIIPTEWLKKHNKMLSIAIILLLVSPLLPFIGQTIAGTRRWVGFGMFSFQPSEIAKMLIVIYLAYQISTKKNDFTSSSWNKNILSILVFLGICSFLILLQKDFSTTVIFIGITFAILFVNGLNVKLLFYIGLSIIGLLTPFVLFSPYRLERINMLIHFSQNPQNAYQIYQSINAFNRGGLMGMGPGDGKYNIPYIFNDFIFAAAGEEFGFIGCSAILLLFVIFFIKGLTISKALASKNLYESIIAFGFTFNIVFQAITNMAVNMAIIFPTGIPLPLLSYGRTSFIICSFATGMLLQLSKKI